MMTKERKHILLLVLMLILALTMMIGGVYSAWDYKYAMVAPIPSDVSLNLFLWEEIPTGEQGTIVEQTSTAVADSLNNAGSELNSAISGKTFFGMTSISSVDNIHGSQLRQELGLDPTANFLVEFPNDNTRILYTTTVEMGTTSSWASPDYLIPQGEWVYPVYKTEVHLDPATNQWVQSATQRGYAASGEYVTFLTSAAFFDPKTWKRGKLGSGFDDAICTYIGQNVTSTQESETDASYYKLTIPSRNTNVTVNITSPAEGVATVYDGSRNPMNATGNGTNNVTFRSSGRNSIYYIAVSGAKDIAFSVS